jgi:manganese efflux pump family protein
LIVDAVKVAILNIFAPAHFFTMDIVTLLLVALGLSFDSFAISLTCGVVEDKIIFRAAVRMAFIMAFFQGGFTVVGFFLGSIVSSRLESVDHWIAMGLLGFLGARMVINGLWPDKNGNKNDITSFPNIVTMAVGTSIDALAVGVSFAFLALNIWYAGFIIGAVTFLASMTAIRLGKSAGKKLGPRTEIIGGVILIAIGLRILYVHLA